MKILSQFVRFIIFGFLAVVVEFFAFYVFLKFNVDYRLATVISFLISVTIAFVLNRHYTFAIKNGSEKYRQYFKYLIVNVLGIFVDFFTVYSFVSVSIKTDSVGALDIDRRALLGKSIAIIITLFFNFVVHRLYTFR